MATHTISMQNFETTMESNDFVFLDFWASWCGPCKTLSPVFEKLAEENPDILFGKVDVETERELAEAFQVRGVPTLIGFHKGEIAFEVSGLPRPEQLLELLDKIRISPPPAEVPEEFANTALTD